MRKKNSLIISPQLDGLRGFERSLMWMYQQFTSCLFQAPSPVLSVGAAGKCAVQHLAGLTAVC